MQTNYSEVPVLSLQGCTFALEAFGFLEELPEAKDNMLAEPAKLKNFGGTAQQTII